VSYSNIIYSSSSANLGHAYQRKRVLQIADHETCSLVDERSNRFVREFFRAVQNGSMRQRLYRCHAHERRQAQVDGVKLIAVQSATSSFRANATIVVLHRRPPLRSIRPWNQRVSADRG
jgi:hypothetical protein